MTAFHAPTFSLSLNSVIPQHRYSIPHCRYQEPQHDSFIKDGNYNNRLHRNSTTRNNQHERSSNTLPADSCDMAPRYQFEECTFLYWIGSTLLYNAKGVSVMTQPQASQTRN